MWKECCQAFKIFFVVGGLVCALLGSAPADASLGEEDSVPEPLSSAVFNNPHLFEEILSYLRLRELPLVNRAFLKNLYNGNRTPLVTLQVPSENTFEFFEGNPNLQPSMVRVQKLIYMGSVPIEVVNTAEGRFSPHLKGLIWGAPVDLHDWALLTGLKFQSLTKLTLSDAGIGDEHARTLSMRLQQGNFPSLSELSLYKNRISDVGIGFLAEAVKTGCLKNLSYLNLTHNVFGDPGLESLAKAFTKETSPLLEVLCCSVGEKRFTDDGVHHLIETSKRGGCPKLLKLNLCRSGAYKPETEEALYAAFKGAQVILKDSDCSGILSNVVSKKLASIC